MVKRRKFAPFSMAEERLLIAMAAEAATVEEAASKLKREIETVQMKSRKLGIPIKNGRLRKRYAAPKRSL
jgi:hypothetical protein